MKTSNDLPEITFQSCSEAVFCCMSEIVYNKLSKIDCSIGKTYAKMLSPTSLEVFCSGEYHTIEHYVEVLCKSVREEYFNDSVVLIAE